MTIDPRGRWTARQLAHVLPIVNADAAAFGLVYRPRLFDMVPCDWFFLDAVCLAHGAVVSPGSTCEICAVGDQSRRGFVAAMMSWWSLHRPAHALAERLEQFVDYLERRRSGV